MKKITITVLLGLIGALGFAYASGKAGCASCKPSCNCETKADCGEADCKAESISTPKEVQKSDDKSTTSTESNDSTEEVVVSTDQEVASELAAN